GRRRLAIECPGTASRAATAAPRPARPRRSSPRYRAGEGPAPEAAPHAGGAGAGPLAPFPRAAALRPRLHAALRSPAALRADQPNQPNQAIPPNLADPTPPADPAHPPDWRRRPGRPGRPPGFP